MVTKAERSFRTQGRGGWFLDQLRIPAMANRRGELSEQVKEVLLLTDSKAQQAQPAIDRFLSNYWSRR
jgi:hypothetical protein